MTSSAMNKRKLILENIHVYNAYYIQKNPEFSGYLPTGCTTSVLVCMSKKKS